MTTKPMSDDVAVCRWCGKPINRAPDSPSGWIHETWSQRSKCGHYAEPLNPQPATGEGVCVGCEGKPRSPNIPCAVCGEGVGGEFEDWWIKETGMWQDINNCSPKGLARAAWNAARKGIK